MKAAHLNRNVLILGAFVALLAFPISAHAHPNIADTHGLWMGVAHPLTGLDHLCAIFAVGLWAAQRGGRATWLLPLTFAGAMIVGAVLGIISSPIAAVDQGIAASVLVLGLFIAFAADFPMILSAGVVALFALLHGHAHGTEMPATASGLAYGLGFAGSTLGLLAAGVGVGSLIQCSATKRLFRYAGAAIAGCGLVLCLV
jgi:urease accessory protein